MVKFLPVVIFFILIAFKPPVDPDFGWHYRYGEYTVQNTAFLRENTFSYTFADYYWANSYWIPQAFFYVLYENLGAVGMGIISSSLLAIAAYFVLRKTFESNFSVAFALIVLSLTFDKFVVSVRPLMFSSIFMLILVAILLFKKKYIKFLPLLYLVWANSHADFVLGLFVFGVYGFSTWIQARKPLLNKEFFAGVLSVLVTFMNPYTYHLHLTLLKETHPFQFLHIGEWQPYGNTDTFLVFFVFFVALSMVASFELKDKFGIWYLVLLVFFAVLSVRSIYFFRVNLLLSVFVSAVFVEQYGLKLATVFSEFNKSKIYKTFLISSVFVFISGVYLFTKNVYLAQDVARWSSASEYPYGAVQHLKENKYDGNMFNYYTWGGYLIWQLPEYKTFIDGRMPSWRTEEKSLFEDYIEIATDTQENIALFESYIEKYNINILLHKEDAEMLSVLLENGWETVYEDDIAVVMVRKPI